MQRSKSVSPPNSLLFISDENGGKPPLPRRGALIQSTPSCISVGCYPEQDGPTYVVIGDISEVDPGDLPEFVGTLETPNRTVVVSTVDGEAVLEANVLSKLTQVKIWVSDLRWPEKVILGLA
jgi:hypothetical protein